MEVTYNTFIEDITNFTLDSYISNKNNLFEDNFNKFYNYYLILEDEEKKKYNANIIKFKKSTNTIIIGIITNANRFINFFFIDRVLSKILFTSTY